MHLRKRGGFDISLFYRDIISTAEDEDLGVHFEESSKLEDLLRKVCAKEIRKRLKLSKDTALTVGLCNNVQKAVKPPPVRLYWETSEPVKSKTRTFDVNMGGLLLPSDTKRSQNYGKKEETEELKCFDEPGLIPIGFKPLMMLKKRHYLRPSLFVHPEESLVSAEGGQGSVQIHPPSEHPSLFCGLVATEEGLDEQKIQVTPPGFQLVFLPYADDKRKLPFTEKVVANPEQID
ncbi:hypothetical protein GH733_007235 [Mirounga leonina]|nr:hypothetical protein GH733_007235 [Mirounga leonina]